MINPKKLVATTKKWRDVRFAGGKMYMPVLSGNGWARASRRLFKRASEALSYAERIKSRWERLYDAALLNMAPPPQEPTA